jgi:hypothetical protein
VHALEAAKPGKLSENAIQVANDSPPSGDRSAVCHPTPYPEWVENDPSAAAAVVSPSLNSEIKT